MISFAMLNDDMGFEFFLTRPPTIPVHQTLATTLSFKPEQSELPSGSGADIQPAEGHEKAEHTRFWSC